MNRDAKFWTKVAPKYAKGKIKDQAAYELTLERTLSYLEPEHSVLELGCGTGSTALLIAPHVGQIKGTDLSEGMIEIARSKADQDGIANAMFETADAVAALQGEASYDAILGFNLFHLVPDPVRTMKAASTRLAPGGLFISKTPCLSGVSLGKRILFRALIPLLQLIGKAPSDVTFFTVGELEAQIEEAGFELVETLSAPAISRYVVARKR